MKILFSIFVAMCFVLSSSAQMTLLKHKKIAAYDTVALDAAKIIQGSIYIPGFDSSFFSFDESKNCLVWKTLMPQDSVTIQYRIFTGTPIIRYAKQNRDDALNAIAATINPSKRNRKKVSSVEYAGVFGRSVGMGNTRGTTVNSELNLELKGFIADSIQVAAIINENNALFQPYGYTQQLNEFDRVQIEFKKKNSALKIGDIDLVSNDTPYLRFSKRVQGFMFSQQHSSGFVTGSASLSKGKFAKNVFNGQEGNQGPYRLTANNHESFLIVLAGSEKVYLNGERLIRGEDADYIIDYNTAALTFTAKRMITKDLRIQIEFEYADRSYLNSLLFITGKQQLSTKLSLTASLYSNTDAKNYYLNGGLDGAQKRFLSEIGDDPQNAFYTDRNEKVFSTDYIMYAYRDTIVNGLKDSVYVYSVSEKEAKYIVHFTEVGANKGNYILYNTAANGNVYKWVAPENGKPQGNFIAARFLVTPKSHRVVTVGVQYLPSTSTLLTINSAISGNDQNRFSSTNADRQPGIALQVTGAKSFLLNAKRDMKMQIQTSVERIAKKFEAPERIRDFEFQRMWGLAIDSLKTEEQLYKASVQLSDSVNYIKYQFQNYGRSDAYTGNKHSFSNSIQFNSWLFSGAVDLTKFRYAQATGKYFKPGFNISHQFKRLPIQIEIAYQKENSLRFDAVNKIGTGSVTNEILEAQIHNKNDGRLWSLKYLYRTNHLPRFHQMQLEDRSHTYEAGLQLFTSNSQKFDLHVAFRNLEVTTGNNSQNLIGRVQYDFAFFQGKIKGQVTGESGPGQQPKRTQNYFEVPAGRGEYTWIDYNHDSIKQVNEFEKAIFPDQAKFVKWYSSGNEYVRTDFGKLNYSITVIPFVSKSNGSKFRQLLNRFTLQSSLLVSNDCISQNFFSIFPLFKHTSDTSIVQSNSAIKNYFHINRGRSKWDASVFRQQSGNTMLLNFGTEKRTSNEEGVKFRYAVSSFITAEATASRSIAQNQNPNFPANEYRIAVFNIESKLYWNYSNQIHYAFGFQKQSKANKTELSNEAALINSLTAEIKMSLTDKSNLTANIDFNKIFYSGKLASSVSYNMLSGMLPGNNFLWSMALSHRVRKMIDLTFQYQGRKAPQTKIIHNGTIGLQAIL